MGPDHIICELVKKLFDYDHQESGGNGETFYVDCTLEKSVGNHPKGTKIPEIIIDVESLSLELIFNYDSNGKPQDGEIYSLTLNVE